MWKDYGLDHHARKFLLFLSVRKFICVYFVTKVRPYSMYVPSMSITFEVALQKDTWYNIPGAKADVLFESFIKMSRPTKLVQ